MKSDRMKLFKQLFNEYCQSEMDNGRCDQDSCNGCPVNAAYNEIFKDSSDNLTDRLYMVMSDEQDKFRDEIATQDFDGVLGYASEYAIRENILILVQDGQFDDDVCEALLQSDTPLADCYRLLTDAAGESDIRKSIMNTLNAQFEDPNAPCEPQYL